MSTLSELQSDLDLYRTARKNILTAGQSMGGSGGRTLTMADLKWVDAQIQDLERRITLEKKGGKVPGSHVIFGGHRG